MNIDVEGMEYPVLCGRKHPFLWYQPLITAEDGLNNSPLIDYLKGLGYQVAEPRCSTLRLATPGSASGIYGFFVQHDRLDRYRSVGILPEAGLCIDA